MLTNHFSIGLLDIFADELNILNISIGDFLMAARTCHFDPCAPHESKHNFVEACNIICGLALPRQSSKATISVASHFVDEADIQIVCGAVSTVAGREYMEALSADSAKALILYDLIVGKAKRLGFSIAT